MHYFIMRTKLTLGRSRDREDESWRHISSMLEKWLKKIQENSSLLCFSPCFEGGGKKYFLVLSEKRQRLSFCRFSIFFLMSRFVLKCFRRHKVAEKQKIAAKNNNLGKRRGGSKCSNTLFTYILVLFFFFSFYLSSAHTCFTLFVFCLVLPWWFMVTLYTVFEDLSKWLTHWQHFRKLAQERSQTCELERSLFSSLCCVAVWAERVQGRVLSGNELCCDYGTD